jgi:Mn2+/Fe2+ NRAMP family transporter
MGNYTNTRAFNAIAWLTCGILIVLTGLFAASAFSPRRIAG